MIDRWTGLPSHKVTEAEWVDAFANKTECSVRISLPVIPLSEIDLYPGPQNNSEPEPETIEYTAKRMNWRTDLIVKQALDNMNYDQAFNPDVNKQ